MAGNRQKPRFFGLCGSPGQKRCTEKHNRIRKPWARGKGRPWRLGKDVEQFPVCSEVVPMPGAIIGQGEIALSVNRQIKQKSDVNQPVWDARKIIADLSPFYHRQPGYLTCADTPEGVAEITLSIGAAG